MAQRFLTADEVADRYSGNISVRTLANWRVNGGGPPYTKLGGKVLYPVDKLDEWEAKRTVHSTSEYRK